VWGGSVPLHMGVVSGEGADPPPKKKIVNIECKSNVLMHYEWPISENVEQLSSTVLHVDEL